jgi:CHAT domain-containing protein
MLHLDADWVILSACNTGAAETENADGLSGLARAFMFAGARSLLVSHWPVRDAMAARLTTDAVRRTNDGRATSRARALRDAMREVLEDTKTKSGWHPSVWAPFQIVGVETQIASDARK